MIEDEAKENGWLPEEEFKAIQGNEGKKWRSAEEFMDRKSLFDKIDSQHKAIKNLEAAQQHLVEHSRKVEASAYERARKDLVAEKAQAAEENDLAKVEAIRDKIDELDHKAHTPPPAPSVTPPPEFVEWETQNKWYVNDVEMRAAADAFGQGLIRAGKAPAEVLRQVSQKIKQMYPEKFRNPNKDSAPPVDGATRTKPSPKGEYEPTEVEKNVMEKMLRARVPSRKDPSKPMTREEYIEELKAINQQR